MSCLYPLQAWVAPGRTKNGKTRIVFQRSKGYSDREISLPCGQCVSCRLERSRQWAMRCYHESKLYEENSFITLTYNDLFIPKDGSLDLRHFQLFMKRLRKKYEKKDAQGKVVPIRFFHCGEYGEHTFRPHYHACLFNFDFPDKKFICTSKGNKVYRSEDLDFLWGMGNTSIGEVSFESAAYVARYIMKKVTGEEAQEYWYEGRTPEYVTMSRRPGIGKEWLKKYVRDVYTNDYVVINGKKMKPPVFYDKAFEEFNKEELRAVKARRKPVYRNREEKRKYLLENGPRRLAVKEKVVKSRLRESNRNLEVRVDY